ncbi:MAG: PDZ domain-containing protein [Planctomycetota bacterium]
MTRVLILVLAALVCAAPAIMAADTDLAPKLRAALVTLKVTSQAYDLQNPWKTSDDRTSTSRGVLIDHGIILTKASNVRNRRMITVSVANSSRQYQAKLKHVDYRIGLAQVEIIDPELKRRLSPLEIGDPVKLDDEFDIYQLGRDNLVERATARVVRADASGARLSLRVKTTLSDSGNGQIAVRDGKIVGLVTGTYASRQEGTLLSVETIRHYLNDFKDGKYDGLPGGGIWWRPLLRDDLRAYYGVGDDQHGMAVTRVMPDRTGHPVLKAGDVITEASGFALDDEGNYVDPIHGQLSASYLFQGRQYAGDKIPLKILRKGKPMEIEILLPAWPTPEQRVPRGSVDKRPEFLVRGGLVILELTRNRASRIGRSPNGVVLRRYRDRAGWDPPSERKRIVYVNTVLADPTNKGFETNLNRAVIKSVNGQPIHRLRDVLVALESPEGKYHVFRFEGLSPDFVIEASKLAEIDKRIADTYKVTLTEHLEDDEKEEEGCACGCGCG